MALSGELKAMLVCPRCKGELVFREAENEIDCRACKLIYEIRENLPVMLAEEAKPMRNIEG